MECLNGSPGSQLACLSVCLRPSLSFPVSHRLKSLSLSLSLSFFPFLSLSLCRLSRLSFVFKCHHCYGIGGYINHSTEEKFVPLIAEMIFSCARRWIFVDMSAQFECTVFVGAPSSVLECGLQRCCVPLEAHCNLTLWNLKIRPTCKREQDLHGHGGMTVRGGPPVWGATPIPDVACLLNKTWILPCLSTTKRKRNKL